MNKFRNAFAATAVFSLLCASASSPTLAASAHNSQIGADGPTADPYSGGQVQGPGAGSVDYKVVKAGEKPNPPCSANDLKTELERKSCD